jgi:Overcoming lysogenization defect protein-like, TOPRIM domain
MPITRPLRHMSKSFDGGCRPAQTSMVIAGWPFISRPDVADVAGVRVDLAGVSQARKIVLVEGRSDQAALEVLARRRGLAVGRGALCIVAMGGATSIGHFVRLLGPRGLSIPLGGVCDAGQEDYVRGALARGGLSPAASRA